jgi:hypothetical protein
MRTAASAHDALSSATFPSAASRIFCAPHNCSSSIHECIVDPRRTRVALVTHFPSSGAVVSIIDCNVVTPQIELPWETLDQMPLPDRNRHNYVVAFKAKWKT